MRKRTIAAVAVLVALVALSGGSGWASEKPIVLRLASVVPPTSTKNLACLRFSELVARDTKGAVQVQVFPAGQLGNEMALAQGVLMGTVDVFWGDAAAFASQVKEFNVFNSPLLFRDLKHWNTIVWGPIFDDLVGRFRTLLG